MTVTAYYGKCPLETHGAPGSGDSVTQGTSASAWKHFHLPQRRAATSIQGGEAGDAAVHPTMPRTAPRSPAPAKTYLVQNVNDAKEQKP